MINVIKRTITKKEIGAKALIPVTNEGQEKISKMREEREVVIQVKTDIDPRYFRLMFGLAKCLSINSHEDSWYHNKDPYLIIKILQEDIGDGIWSTKPDGTKTFFANSLSFQSRLSNEKYDIISEKLFDIVSKVLDIDVVELKRNYRDIL